MTLMKTMTVTVTTATAVMVTMMITMNGNIPSQGSSAIIQPNRMRIQPYVGVTAAPLLVLGQAFSATHVKVSAHVPLDTVNPKNLHTPTQKIFSHGNDSSST